MAEEIGTASGGHPNLNLTVEEKRFYDNLFKEADPDGFGAVSGDVAVKFFERTRLPPDILGQIWQIADTENRGFLTPAGFGVVLRLIGHAQAGRQPSVAVAPQPAPLPRFDATATQAAQPPPPPPPAPPAQTISQQSTGPPSSPSSGAAPIRVPALNPEKVTEYSGLFEKSGAENGLLSGLVAKQIFERARLPNEVLGRIWGLADTQGRGTLDVSEFVIAMHLLASYKSGAMRGVPNTLPPGLLDAASRRVPARMSGGPPPVRPGSASGQVPMQPQYSGLQQPAFRAPPSPVVNRQMAGTPLSTQSTGEAWLINAGDKSRFDGIFATIDTANQGFISGEQAVTFFGNARLPEEVLAQIWDLADINSDGVLNRDEFAVAMFLIRQQRGSRDGRVPSVLPTALVPPSMRKQQQPSQPATMPSFEDATATKPRSAADDLFGLDVSDQPPQQPLPVQHQQPPPQTQPTQATDPFSSPQSARGPTSSPPPSTLFKPFVPSSTFGQGLVPQGTTSSAQGQKKEASLMDDEDDPAAAPKINNDAAELGNLSNQVSNLSKQMQDVSTQRSQAEQELSQNSQQKQAFQQRLTQLRSAYDQEVAQVKSLKDQLATSQTETKRLQQDMAMIEGTHADIKTQHQQLASALAADQQEIAALKERIRLTNAETEQLKPQLEKLKSDARQQKGLVVINKKQLSHNETERDEIKAKILAHHQEIEVAQREIAESARLLEQSQKELEESRKALEQAKAIPVPTPAPRELSPPPQVASPTPSVSSNPFFRRQEGAVFSPPIGSTVTSPAPQAEHDRNSAFDAIFGPSLGGSAAAPAPETSFGREPPEIERAATPDTPKVIEPPAPPVSTQIGSSALPYRAPLEREDSVSSSVRVAPPASRLSPAHTPRGLTPDTSTESPASHRADDPFAVSSKEEEHGSSRQPLERNDTQDKTDTLPGAFPGSRSATPAQSGVNPTAVAVGAGVATIAAGAGIAAAAVSSQEEPKTQQVENKDNFDDFFGAPSHKKTLSEQRADFDSAFASMDKGKQPMNGQPKPASGEFPDIQEFDNDDDSSSDDSSEPHGFDDNFAPATSKAAGKLPEVAPQPSLAPPIRDANASSTSLPRIESQQSPPAYKDAVPNDNPNHFPMEYKNLLPEREDPTSPPPMTGDSTKAANSSTGAPPSYGPEVGSPTTASRSASLVAEKPPTQAAPFDFDSAFANLGSAPVAEDSDSDYEDAAPGGRSNHPVEFEPTFDSPAPSTKTTSTFPQPISIHDAVTSPTSAVTNGASSASPTVPTQMRAADFDEFNSNPFPPSRTGTQPSQPATSPVTTSGNAISHDWDALFAPLDSQPQVAKPTTDVDDTSPPLARTTTGQATEIGAGLTAVTSHEAVHELTPQASTFNVPTISTVAGTSANQLKPNRPPIGRALTEGTEHDDPILKRLTAMGWSRADSLAALEKFDYNIDKAADYLTFKN